MIRWRAIGHRQKLGIEGARDERRVRKVIDTCTSMNDVNVVNCYGFGSLSEVERRQTETVCHFSIFVW